jgi:hypothetical protein
MTMGVWGAGGFENDTALDFVGEASDAADLAAAFDAVLRDPAAYLDVDAAQRAIAAAECVAAMLGRAAPEMPVAVADRMASLNAPDAGLLDAARSAVSRVLRRSELVDLWAGGEASAFNLAITSLIERLSAAPPRPATARGKRKRGTAAPVRQTCSFCNTSIEPNQLFMFQTTDMSREVPSDTRGAWCHLACLNARLHPAHLIQNWTFAPEALESDVRRILGEDDKC